jgi:hypothetical protein
MAEIRDGPEVSLIMEDRLSADVLSANRIIGQSRLDAQWLCARPVDLDAIDPTLPGAMVAITVQFDGPAAGRSS